MRSNTMKEAQARYQEKLKRVVIYFSPNEIELYDKLQATAKNERKSVNRIIKDFISKY